MARPKKMPIDEQIRRKKEEVYKQKQKYEAELEELHTLMEEKKKQEAEKICEAYQQSGKSFEEIMHFLSE